MKIFKNWVGYVWLLIKFIVCPLQVLNLIKPIASVKRLQITLNMASDLPEYARGDEKRLMQTVLNVVGNAVKFSKEGTVSVTAFVAKPESLRELRIPDFFPVSGNSHFYLRVQVGIFDEHRSYLGFSVFNHRS